MHHKLDWAESVKIHSKLVGELMTFHATSSKPEENKHTRVKEEGNLHEDSKQNV